MLKTDFVKIAESGKTLDGNMIADDVLLQVAAGYDESVYCAVVTDGNDPSSNLGIVEALKAVTEKDGKTGLYAQISPNLLWQAEVKKGQKLFVSVQISENFAGEIGRHYLTGLVASNQPANLGSSMMQFSKAKKGMLFVKSQQLPTGLNASEQNWYSSRGVSATDYGSINPMAV